MMTETRRFGYITEQNARWAASLLVLLDEEPASIGLVLRHLPPEPAGRLLEALPQALRERVWGEMAASWHLAPTSIAALERRLRASL